MLLFDGVIFSLQKAGGVSVYFSNLLKRIGKETDSAMLLCYSNLSDDFESVLKSQLQPRFLERYRDVLDNSEDCIFHSSYYRLPACSRYKIVTTVHDFTYEKFVSGPAKWVHSWQKYRAIRNSDIVICVSQNTTRDLMHYCPIDPTKIRVVHNGVSECYHELPEVHAKTNEVLFVGARASYKNFDIAIDTLAKLPELSLSIVGGGPLSQTEIKRLNTILPGRHTWLGRLCDEELNMAYNRAYALLYPSSYEGFGIPIIEAMRAGCPVVAVNVSSIPEVAGAAAVLTEVADSDLFVAALSQVSHQRNDLIKAGFEQAKKFSWDKCFEETLKVYKELM